MNSSFWKGRVTDRRDLFSQRLSNVIGFNGLFDTLNLGAARTQGVEIEFKRDRYAILTLSATYTYLDAENTSSADITQPHGARLPRRPRNEVLHLASYLWCKKLRTTAEAKFVNAREELNFGGAKFRHRRLFVCELCGRVRNECTFHDLRPDR